MNMKFKIESPEHSKRIQEELFKLGYVWGSGKNIVINTDNPYLYIEHNKIVCGFDDDIFISDKSKEKTLADLIEINKKDEGLISGKEAFDAFLNGGDVEFMDKTGQWRSVFNNTILKVFMDYDNFRLKPKTVTINGVEYNKIKEITADYIGHTIEIQLSSRDDTEKLRKYIAETFLYK